MRSQKHPKPRSTNGPLPQSSSPSLRFPSVGREGADRGRRSVPGVRRLVAGAERADGSGNGRADCARRRVGDLRRTRLRLLDVVGEPEGARTGSRSTRRARLAVGGPAGARRGTRRARGRRGERPALAGAGGEASARGVPAERAGRVARGTPRESPCRSRSAEAAAVLARLSRPTRAVRVLDRRRDYVHDRFEYLRSSDRWSRRRLQP
jgi:hypothetical protein